MNLLKIILLCSIFIVRAQNFYENLSFYGKSNTVTNPFFIQNPSKVNVYEHNNSRINKIKLDSLIVCYEDTSLVKSRLVKIKYNDKGYRIEDLEIIIKINNTFDTFITSYEYDSIGRMILQQFKSQKWEYTYTEFNKILTQIETYGSFKNKISYEYTPSQLLSKKINAKWDTAINDWVESYKVEYFFDSLQKKIVSYEYSKISNQSDWKYEDKSILVLNAKFYPVQDSIFIYDTKTSNWIFNYINNYGYDKFDNLNLIELKIFNKIKLEIIHDTTVLMSNVWGGGSDFGEFFPKTINKISNITNYEYDVISSTWEKTSSSNFYYSPINIGIKPTFDNKIKDLILHISEQKSHLILNSTSKKLLNVQLIDIKGRTLYSTTMKETLIINTLTFCKGIYFIYLKNENQNRIISWIKK